MNKQKIKGCRQVLEAKRGEILASGYKTEDLVAGRVPDAMEELTLEVQRNMYNYFAVESMLQKLLILVV